ncbi:MAG: class I adenylate-forming enzyme family protein [Bryobacteraceae bacterium]
MITADAADILGERARLTPDSIALIYVPTDQSFTYAQLDRRATICARIWMEQCGLSYGDRAGILAENRVEYMDAFWAAGKSGVILVPLGTRSTARELAQIVRDSGMQWLMYSARFQSVVDELRQLAPCEGYIHLDPSPAYPNDPDYADCRARTRADALPKAPLLGEDIYCLLYTSGTTGTPKGVMIPHRQIAWNAYNTVVSWQLRDSDSVQIFTPLYHAGGLAALLAPLFAIGGCVLLHDGFDPSEILRTFARRRCSILFGVPTTFRMLMDAPEFATTDFSHARWCISGGAPLPAHIISAFQKRGVAFKQGYGLTEVGVNCFAMTAEDSVRKAGSIGKPLMFTEAKIIGENGDELPDDDVGELCFRGLHVCRGYWNNPEATRRALDPDGWFHTGDLARRDAEGFYYIAGRLKDMIISGGVNVYPAEIERELLLHPAVADVAVAGIPDEKWGEVPVAFVVLNARSSADPEQLLAFLASRLNKIKLPKHFHFLDVLPRNAYGKVLKNELRAGLLDA